MSEVNETIRDVIEKSLAIEPIASGGSSHIFNLHSKHSGLSNYMLRVMQTCDYDAWLKSTTHLTTTKMLWSGFATSQPLLTEQQSADNTVERPNPREVTIIRRQPGEPLHDYFSQHGMQEFMRDCLEDPKPLQELMDQITYLCTHANWAMDLSPSNILYHNKQFSLVDVFSMDDNVENIAEPFVYRESPHHQISFFDTPDTPDAHRIILLSAASYAFENLKDTFIEEAVDIAKTHPIDGDIYERFFDMFDEMAKREMATIEHGEAGANKPHWKGFIDTSDVKAISLDAPASELKEMLDAVYDNVIPSR